MERTIQTATPLAEHLGLQIQADEAFVEVDFGSWSGLTLTELDAIPEWKIFNQFRSSFRLPGGEMMLEVQRRVVEGLARHAAANSGKIVAVFSHADVIRAAVSHYIGAPLDLMHRFEIHPASVTRIQLFDAEVKISGVNEHV